MRWELEMAWKMLLLIGPWEKSRAGLGSISGLRCIGKSGIVRGVANQICTALAELWVGPVAVLD